MTEPAIPTDPDEIVAELEHLAGVMSAAAATAEKARDRRLKLWLAARAGDPQPTFARLAQASGVREPYVTRVVNETLKAEAAEAAPTG